jgi:hypothetical protein
LSNEPSLAFHHRLVGWQELEEFENDIAVRSTHHEASILSFDLKGDEAVGRATDKLFELGL